MLFNSIEFFIFFAIVLALYWGGKRSLKWQNLLLLGAGYLFYGWWDVRFLFLIAFSTVLDFNFALRIDRGLIERKVQLKTMAFLAFTGLFFLLLELHPFSLNPVVPKVRFRSEYFSIFLFVIAYFIGLYTLDRQARTWEPEKSRKIFLVICITTNLLLLGVFKYFNFFLSSFSSLFHQITGSHSFIPFIHIILPVGLSFYTFQSISYVVDVYRKDVRPTDRFLDYAAYLIFFPQLVAGPIERGKHLLPQFLRKRPELTKSDINDGIWLIVWGLYKKIVIADNLAKIVNATFLPFDQGNFVLPNDGFRLLIALYAFALQIYGDFSGYTDIARGTARLLGFEIVLNFNLPYFARTPSDFWRRWHISLSSWLRDYLYIPLGGNRGKSWFLYRNLMITMGLGGLWHGASWTFLYWGIFHGLILCIYRALKISEDKKYSSWGVPVLQVCIMFHLTCVGWLLFRAKNLDTVWIFLQGIFCRFQASELAWVNFWTLFEYSWLLILYQVIQLKTKNLFPLRNVHWFIRFNVILYLAMSILSFTDAKPQEFIYFAF